MKSSVLFCSLIILLVNVLSGSVWANVSDSVIIPLESSDPGNNLTLADVNWPADFDQQIELVNQGRGEFYVEIYNDPTIWEMVKHLKKQRAVLDSNQMNLTMDAALNVARFQNVIRLMKAKGLKRLKLSYAPDRGDSSYILIYYLPDQDNDQTTTVQAGRTDTVFIFSSFTATDEARWSLNLGGEMTAVSEGAPVIVPSLSLTMSKDKYSLSLTGGYRPGDFDQKFFSGSLVYFPRSNDLGVQTSLIYASETVETLGAYVQQGYGLTVGVLWQHERFGLHLAPGLQYFDRRGQDRRAELTINLGLGYQILSL